MIHFFYELLLLKMDNIKKKISTLKAENEKLSDLVSDLEAKLKEKDEAMCGVGS